VTRLTASARAANERTNSRCSDFTRRHCWYLVASAIRTCSPRTRRWTWRQSMLCQSVGCEDAGTARVAACAAGLTVLILLSSEVLCFESTPAEQTDLPPYGESLSPRKGIEGRCYSTFPHLSLSHVGRFTRLHAVEDQQDVSPVSGAACWPLSSPLQAGICFFLPPIPAMATPNIPEGTITGLPSSVCSN